MKRTTVLKITRISHGLTLDELAECVGSSAPVISRIETGRRKPSAELAARLERHFHGKTIDELLSDVMPAPPE